MQSFINGGKNGVKWAFWRLAKLGGGCRLVMLGFQRSHTLLDSCA